MALIRTLEEIDNDCMRGIAELHIKAFPSFFLTQLGRSFLENLYIGYMENDNSGIIIAEDNGKLLGFIAYSNDYSGFYKSLLEKHIFKFAFCAMGAAIRHPSFIKRLLGALKKSDEVIKKEKYVELASICVDPDAKYRGIGTALIDYLKGAVDFSQYAYINLETDRDGNDDVNRFYKKNDFQLAFQYTTKEGRRMNEYRYAPYYEERSRMT